MRFLQMSALCWLLLAPALIDVNAAPPTARKPCAPSLAECPDEGCGPTADVNLNRRKNITEHNMPGGLKGAQLRTVADIMRMPDPEHFKHGDDRDELEKLGEGTLVKVAAYLIAAKLELGGESCNCGLHSVAETDNHLVLVTRAALLRSNDFTARERESITAEFTPRVRLTHPKFTRATVQPLIEAAPSHALLVRVTGQLLFDSEHYFQHHLKRVTNWEIHPVVKFEVCARARGCRPDADDGWRDIEQ